MTMQRKRSGEQAIREGMEGNAKLRAEAEARKVARVVKLITEEDFNDNQVKRATGFGIYAIRRIRQAHGLQPGKKGEE